VALKVDEAPLVINAAFAQTLALKRSAGLETVACWQTDAQWEPELRAQLDALFAHRVLFATASADDARRAAALLMSDYSDQIRAGDEELALLASPDVRLHLPRHTALVSWTTAAGRERPFLATTMPLRLDPALIEWHARAQQARGGRELAEPGAAALAAAPGAAAVAGGCVGRGRGAHGGGRHRRAGCGAGAAALAAAPGGAAVAGGCVGRGRGAHVGGRHRRAGCVGRGRGAHVG
jgi:hypothetical protein